MLPVSPFAFVDLETTGTRAEPTASPRSASSGSTPRDGGAPRVTEWSTLVDPDVPIPPAIQALTGITDAMVASAPTFSTIAGDVSQLLAGCVFVAHNARFDYGFLKHAFARLGRPFTARVLCTVRLSRRLFPDADGHGLDAVIARHRWPSTDRHRALGDARALWSFVQALYRDFARETIDDAIKRILRIPSLPPQLPPDALDALPEAPGVYLFYGDNPLPLYIGKSINLRERVAAHFSQDWRSETDLRLSQEIRRIEFEETAGELGALLREAVLVKSRLPAHNRALRRKVEAGVLEIADRLPRFVAAAGIDCARLAGTLRSVRVAAPARARAARARRASIGCAGAPRARAARGRTVLRTPARRCAGACVGAESPESHDARLAEALAPLAIPRWPAPAPRSCASAAPLASASTSIVFRDWCWLGTARDDGELARSSKRRRAGVRHRRHAAARPATPRRRSCGRSRWTRPRNGATQSSMC